MTRRRDPARLLFDDTIQPRYVEPEPLYVYEAVLRARAKRVLVFRVGRKEHLLRKSTTRHGRRVSTAQLLAMFPP